MQTNELLRNKIEDRYVLLHHVENLINDLKAERERLQMEINTLEKGG